MKHCLFLGDSITDANHFFTENPLGDGYVSLIRKQLDEKDYHLTNKGHDGFTVEQLWRMLSRDELSPAHGILTSRHWDFITILIGVNDIPVEVYTNRTRIPLEYETYYRQILDYVRCHSNAKLILIEPFLFNQPAIYKSWQIYVQAESQIIQKLAKEYDALFLPANHILQEECAKQGTALITYDGIHLTESGNQILADLWLAALDGAL